MANKNITQLVQQTSAADPTSLFYTVTGGNTDRSLPLSVFVNNLGLTGIPTAPTAISSTNTTQIASTAFVQSVVGNYLQKINNLSDVANVTTARTNLGAAATSGTLAQFAATTSAQLAGVISDETGSGALVFGTSPTIVTPTITGGSINNTPIGATTPNTGAFTTITATGTITPSTTAGIVGTTSANNANAGSIGEFLTNTGTSTGLTTATYVNLAQITLTAGDWDVSGGVSFTISAGATALIAGVNTVSNTNPGGFQITTLQTTSTFGNSQFSTPVWRFNVSTNTTVFLGGQANFTSGTVSGTGFIRARRVR